MSKVPTSTCAVLAFGGLVAGCQSAPVQYANSGVHATYQVASTGAGAVKATGGQLYVGAGAALRAPLRDLNMMQDKIAPVLLRAEQHPYDLSGVNSCNDVLDRVSELDLALGPDVDTPKAPKHTRVVRGADFAASTALDAAGSAAEHFIPMRGTIKQISGAQRYENHVKHAALAGTTRRSFLKAIGMEHNCTWPAAPLDFTPTQVADASAAWSPAPALGPGQTGGAPIQLASQTVHPAAAGAVAPGQTASNPAALATSGRAIKTARAEPAHMSMEPVSVPIYNRITLPAAVSTTADPSQAWRRPAAPSELVDSQITDASATTSGRPAPPPWSAAFSGSNAHP